MNSLIVIIGSLLMLGIIIYIGYKFTEHKPKIHIKKIAKN
jgi:hypothetical protein